MECLALKSNHCCQRNG